METQTPLPKALTKAMTDFLTASIQLTETWVHYDHTGEALIEGYPFDKSFNDVVTDIRDWVNFHTTENVQ